MEFWGSEVKIGETIKVQPGDGRLLHLSQASLGESKKDKANELVNLFVNVDGKKLVIGTLSAEKIPQQQYDLVFDKDFELSHNWKSGSVYFFGYRADNVADDDEDVGPDFESDTDSSESDDDIPLLVENNVKPEEKAKEEKPTEAKKSDPEKDSAPKKNGKAEKAAPIIESEDDDSDDSMSDADGSDSDEDDDDESDSDDVEDSEEETPVKVETGKKRASESEPKTPAANKKVKLATPQKTDGKTGGSTHVATPHPSKQTDKKPKSAGGSHACKSCSKTFGSETGLESHTKAKHSAGK